MIEILRFSGFKIYSWTIFLLLLTYLVLRAIFLEPLHDETTTYFMFIEPGIVIGKGVVQDANNHLLNSFIGVASYHFFGENFFLFRLPNLLCFILYFWGVYKIAGSIKNLSFRIIILTAMVTVAFMNDYFAYTRGYGMAMAFFIWMLVYSQKWLEKPSIRNAAILYFFTLMAVFSNLVMLVSACLAVSLVCLVHLREIKRFKLKKQIVLFVLHALFLLGLFPFVWFSYMLRMGGALYYGNLAGFWEVTGKTLARYVLFYDQDWQKWLWLALIIGFGMYLLYQTISRGFWLQLQEKISVFGIYFFGNIAAILVLAHFFKVNYPEDRVGMYFIPLAILIFGFMVWNLEKIRFAIVLLLFFPITFLLKLNLDTSVFTPDDRISHTLFQSIKKHLKPETTLSIYPLMWQNWAYMERHSGEIKFQPAMNKDFVPLYDVFVNKKVLVKGIDFHDYNLICYEPSSGIIAYKRKIPFRREWIREYKLPEIYSSEKSIELLDLDLADTVFSKDLLMQISGDFKIDKPFKTLHLLISTLNAQGEITRNQYFDQRWYHGKNKLKFTVSINHVLSEISGDETKLRLYIWNPERHRISFKSGETQLYKILNHK